jgi:hypothetical protein
MGMGYVSIEASVVAIATYHHILLAEGTNCA